MGNIQKIKVTIVGFVNKEKTSNYRNFKIDSKEELKSKVESFTKSLYKKYTKENNQKWSFDNLFIEYNGQLYYSIDDLPNQSKIKVPKNLPKVVTPKQAWKILVTKIKNGENDFFVERWIHTLSNAMPKNGLSKTQIEILNKDLRGQERDSRVNYTATTTCFGHIKPNYFLFSKFVKPFNTRLKKVGAKKAKHGVYIEPRKFLEEMLGLEDLLNHYYENYEEFKNYLIDFLGLTQEEVENIEVNTKERLSVRVKKGKYCISFKYNPKTIKILKRMGINRYDPKTKELWTKEKSFLEHILKEDFLKENYNLVEVRSLFEDIF